MTHQKGWILVFSLLIGALMAACGTASQAGEVGSLPQNIASGTPDDFTPPPPPDDAPVEPFVETVWPVVPRLGGGLNELYFSWQADPVQAKVEAIDDGFEIEGDRIFVQIKLEDASLIDAITERISVLNGEVTDHYEALLNAWIPVSNLEEASNLPGVLLITRHLPTEY